MKTITILQIIFGILLTVSILIQQRGSSLGISFGGDSTVFKTKRGIEKSIFKTTIVLSVLFIGMAIVGLFA